MQGNNFVVYIYRSISSVMNLSQQISLSLLELHLDQWNARNVVQTKKAGIEERTNTLNRH